MSEMPGWYPDPSGAPQQRFWDGNTWSSDVRPYPPPSSAGAGDAQGEVSTASGTTANEAVHQPDQPAVQQQSASATRLGAGWKVALVVALVLIAVAGFAFWRNTVDKNARRAALEGALLSGGSLSGGVTTTTPVSNFITVTYRVTANGYKADATSADADVTYQTPSGTRQDSVTSGWSRTFTFSTGDFVYLSAQNMASGTVSCTIEVNGQTLSTNASTGEYKIASCDGSVP